MMAAIAVAGMTFFAVSVREARTVPAMWMEPAIVKVNFILIENGSC